LELTTPCPQKKQAGILAAFGLENTLKHIAIKKS
jgi:hypothetical protein